MTRLTRYVGIALLVAAVPAFGQSVTVSLPAPPLPTVHVIAPAPVVIHPAPVVVVQQQPTTVVVKKGNNGKHKGQRK